MPISTGHKQRSEGSTESLKEQINTLIVVLMATGREEVDRLVEIEVEVAVEVPPAPISAIISRPTSIADLTNSLMTSLYCLWRFWNSCMAAKRSTLRPFGVMKSGFRPSKYSASKPVISLMTLITISKRVLMNNT